MFKKNQIALAARAAAAGMGLQALMLAPALAQQAAAPQRIEITGSAIKRVDAEGALPVQIITREAIAKSGTVSMADLIQALPSMQGFTNEGSSVGGGGTGFSGASLHNLGENYTLVLLNGRRLAQFGGQVLTGALAGVDLNVIPVSAIERIEILADGASALYGADAIAGVVNFITRKDATDGTLAASYLGPSKGGQEASVNFFKGFGDFDKDGFNIALGASAEKRKKLSSVDREFAKTGVINFNLDGKAVTFFNGSPRGIPANINSSDGFLVSPFFVANKKCPPLHVELAEGSALGSGCYFDYVTQLEILPERERTSVYGSGRLKIGGDHSLFAEALFTKTSNTNRIAPPPGELSINSSSPFWPTIIAADPGAKGDVVVPYRVADVGKRTTKDQTKATHFILGGEGTFLGWDYNAAFTLSESKQDSFLLGGWVKLNAFFDALDSGLVNPFVAPGNQSPAALKALQDSRILGFWEGGDTKLNAFELRTSGELAKLPGGPLMLAVGATASNEKFQKRASDLARGIGDTRFGDSAAIVPYGADRDLRAVFSEVTVPVLKTLELGASVRYDDYSDFGGSTTAKGTFKFRPAREVLMRGSYGTGFKAPTVPQVNAALQEFGVTSGNYTCDNNSASDPLRIIAASLGATCPVGNVQYNVFAGGNKALKPEKSVQWTLGLVAEPVPNVSVGVDLWQVKIKDSISSIDEAQIFGDPARWSSLFTSYTDPGTGRKLLAMLSSNGNLGESSIQGVDISASASFDTGFFRVKPTLDLTYIIKERYQLERDGPFFTSVGQFGANGAVTFRTQARLRMDIDHGSFSHSFTTKFKSGYADQAYKAADFAVFDPVTFTPYAYNGMVKRYVTYDWQSKWNFTKMFSATIGVLNLTDEDPPRSLKSAGGGQQIGYDDRYYDPRGRTFYVKGEVRF
jgi:iron complex outermembrane recepter protein